MDKVCWLCGGELPQEIIEKLGTPIAELGLSNRALNCLARRNIEYVEELLQFDMKELLRIRNMGKHTAQEIVQKVNALGFGWLE